MSLKRTLVTANKRLLTALRSGESESIYDQPVEHTDFASLQGQVHCLLVTYRKDGTPVAQPIWPAFDGDRIYVRSEADAYKAKRLRRNPAALIAACDFRGVPKGPPIAATGRILDGADELARAEQVVGEQWGRGRQAFAAAARPVTGLVYMELVPAAKPAAG
jgi:PPOX class probable F420-dependent enzyme